MIDKIMDIAPKLNATEPDKISFAFKLICN